MLCPFFLLPLNNEQLNTSRMQITHTHMYVCMYFCLVTSTNCRRSCWRSQGIVTVRVKLIQENKNLCLVGFSDSEYTVRPDTEKGPLQEVSTGGGTGLQLSHSECISVYFTHSFIHSSHIPQTHKCPQDSRPQVTVNDRLWASPHWKHRQKSTCT